MGLCTVEAALLRPPSSPLDDCLYVTRGLEPPLQLCRYHHSLTPPQCQTVCPSVRIPSQILEMSSTVCSERAAPESLSFWSVRPLPACPVVRRLPACQLWCAAERHEVRHNWALVTLLGELEVVVKRVKRMPVTWDTCKPWSKRRPR